MSDNSTLAELSEQVLADFFPSLVTNYFQLFAAVLVLYDYLLTLSLEQSLVWSRKINIMNTLFFLNRYFGSMEQFGSVFLFFYQPASNAECHVLYYFSEIPNVLSDIAFCGVFTLRTYAIYGKSRTVLIVLAIPAMVSVISTFIAIFSEPTSALPRQLQVGPNTCVFDLTSSLFIGVLINTISNIVFDILVVVLTVYRTAHTAKESKKAKIHRSLSYILFRDGIVYYAVIFLPTFVSCALNAVVLKTGSTILSLSSECLTYVIEVLRIISINRLILNLNYVANARDDWEYRTQTGLDTPIVATSSVLGNIGGLVHNLPDDLAQNAIEDIPVAE